MEISSLPDRIAREVVDEFEKINVKSGKPTVRSNGTKEWSVLAGLVAVDGDSIKVLTLATGVKTMPNQVRKYSLGWIVHDMHAEILCLRMFNWLLVEQIRHFAENGLDLLQETDSDTKCRFRLRKNIKLALYISEPPCGDASMSGVAAGGQAWEEPPTKKHQVMRGRAHFNKVGIVRTKPGRADSLVSLSKSCSDKLCVKQFTGILNCITSILVQPIFLDYLVLRQDKHSETDFQRCFHDRLVGSVPLEHQLKVLVHEKDTYQFHKTDDAVPLVLSSVSCIPSKNTHVLNNGVRNGAFVKNRPPKPSGASPLCRRSLYQQAQPLIGEHSRYLEVKSANKARQAVKEQARAQLDGWPTSETDDFELPHQHTETGNC